MFYKDVGAYPTPDGIETFEIYCQNIRELYLRAGEVAMNKGFKVELGNDKHTNDLKLVCKYKMPFDQSFRGRAYCTFFVRYRFDPAVGYFVMMDYDELHTHPVNENLRQFLDHNKAWRSKYLWSKYEKSELALKEKHGILTSR
jgi:hypothetical protein